MRKITKKRNDGRKAGQQFQKDIEDSCKEQEIFFHNVRDVHIPFDLRYRIPVPKNKYDAFIFYNSTLFAVELKTVADKRIPFSNVPQHQIDNLTEAEKYADVRAGFIFNFRNEPGNPTYFVPVLAYRNYVMIAESGVKEHEKYRGRINKASIPLHICDQIGYKVHSEIKRVHYRYFIKDGLDGVLMHGRRM